MAVLGGTLNNTLFPTIRDEDNFNQNQSRCFYISGEPIVAYQPVALVGGKVFRADRTDNTHLNRVVGVAVESVAAADETILVALHGILENNGWSFTQDDQLFIGVEGAIDTIPGNDFFLQSIGVALTATRIEVKINQAIKRG